MTMSTTDATAAVARCRPDGSIVITTMSTLRTFPVQSPSPLNLGCVPLMGGASALGLGLALAQPERHLIVLDGDGSLLMQLGSLATVAEVTPAKFFHFVFDNGVWFEGGASIPVPASTTLDWTGMARSAGYRTAHSFADHNRLDAELPRILAATGPCFIHLAIDPGRSDRSPWSSTNPQEETPDRQFTRMGDEARVVRSTLKQLPPQHHVAGDADHREEAG